MERLVFVHGSVRNGEAAWAAQRTLANSYELVVLNGPGYPPNPPEATIDFEEQASWVAERLSPGDHLCGHSYGGVVSLFAAGLFPELASLTVLEPPAFGLAAGDPAARRHRCQAGGWSPAFDAVCDLLEERLDGSRAVLPGAGHNPQAAPGFNERLLQFLTSSGDRSPR